MKFKMADMSPAEAAKFLRQAAEATASMSKNWDNLEKIFEEFLNSALEAGRAYGREEAKQ